VKRETNGQILKLVFDFGPLLLFFLVNALYGILAATAIFMAATVAALIGSRLAHGRFAPMPLITGGFVLVFGGLTLYLQDETFIKVKPTVIYLLLAGVLVAGLLAGRPLLKLLMGEAFDLTDEGWRKLTYRWAGFFVALAVCNEIVWRSFSTDAWVSFKVFGLVPLTFLFAIFQIGLLQRYAKPSE
jgi:intracellular septation protein